MITLRLIRLYKNPYYEVYKDGKRIQYIMGFKQAKEVYDKAIAQGEKVELDDSVLQEHSQLIELLKSK